MKRIVNLLHRQAIRAKAEGLFFNVRYSNYSYYFITYLEPDIDKISLGIDSELVQEYIRRPKILTSRTTIQRPYQRDQFHPSQILQSAV